jgi:hypothetical protein
MMFGDYHKCEEPLFAVYLARKDTKHAMKLAKAAGTRLKGVEVAGVHLISIAVKEHTGGGYCFYLWSCKKGRGP